MVNTLKPTIYDQKDPANYIRNFPGLKTEAARQSGVGSADVVQLPVEYDETNLPLSEQYKGDYKELSPVARRAVKLGLPAFAVFLTAGLTAGNTLPEGLKIRADQLIHFLS